jgi:MFS family permease
MTDMLDPLAAETQSATATAPARQGGAFSPLRHRNFSLLFTGQLISLLGDQAYGLALPWTVLAVTGDARQMALVLAVATVPRVALLLIGGVLADRLTPRLIMLGADLGRMGVVGVLGFTLMVGLPPLWVVAVLAGLEGAGSGLFQPGSQALIPATVPDADLPAGNGLIQGLQFLTLTIGPLLGGVATAAQASFAFLVDAASFGVSALSLFGIRLPRRVPSAQSAAARVEGEQPRKAGMAAEIGEGFRYALQTPLVRGAMMVTVFGNLGFTGAISVGLIVLAHNLSGSPVTLGIILAATGVGGIIGGLTSGLLGRMPRRGTIAFALFGLGAVLFILVPVVAGPASGLSIALTLSQNGHVAAVAAATAGIGLILGMADTMFLTILQQRIPAEYRGRVFSIQFLAGGISQPLSLLGAGALVALFGPGAAFLAGAVAVAIAVLLGLSSRELRAM